MGSTRKPHVVLVPFPAHGHVAPHMQLARVLHAHSVHVTLVHTELHHRRRPGGSGLPRRGHPGWAVGGGPAADAGGAPRGDGAQLPRAVQGAAAGAEEQARRAAGDLRGGRHADAVRVSGAREVRVPDVQFFTASACGLMGYLQFEELMRRGLVPLNGNGYKSDGSLDTPLDWVPGMKGLRLRDMPTFCHTTDANNWMVHFQVHQMRTAASSKAVILNTYEIEKDVIDAHAALLPPIYAVCPLASIVASLPASGDLPGSTSNASLLQEDTACMAWLDGKAARSVVYASFGSHANMGGMRLREFASGLALCGSPYLWVLRSDMAADVEVGENGLVVPWCAQEAVLRHPAVGLFVTHCRGNSILESVVAGVPVLGCLVISEQTNCRQVCVSWGIGTELPQGGGSDEIEALVREMMAGKKGKEARERALEWKRLTEVATKDGGLSYGNIDKLLRMCYSRSIDFILFDCCVAVQCQQLFG